MVVSKRDEIYLPFQQIFISSFFISNLIICRHVCYSLITLKSFIFDTSMMMEFPELNFGTEIMKCSFQVRVSLANSCFSGICFDLKILRAL